MEILMNGERRTCPADMTVAVLLEATGHAGQRVAVVRNGQVVPRGQHAATALTEGDRIDIVGAVAGG
ncbi:sulfur carrier protein ThiS [uncultured Propionivibrio sp.]|uniref:sulfur carrier protein ThiS n=1 Tax=uncultured Propionivibrio sp. TaxID=426737 RepID=UPI0029C08A98|nr:sulfur carrier protein ThiS [uncultured Propionivibrio sp.]